MSRAVGRGVVAPAVAEELPGLAIAWTTVVGGPGRPDPGVRDRLAHLASRIGGPQALALRQQDVPHAYRVCFRHVGLDPDVDRTPIEAAVVRRLVEGGFPARERIADACLLAVVETGVGVWALDGAPDGPLTVRAEPDGPSSLRAGFDGPLSVADGRGPVATLFGEVAPERAPGPGTERVTLFAVQVPGVGDLVVDEALHVAADAVAGEEEPSG